MRPLGGVPLLSYTLETASRAESLTRVVVSTDCDAVADLALKTGAQVLRRPAELIWSNEGEIASDPSEGYTR